MKAAESGSALFLVFLLMLVLCLGWSMIVSGERMGWHIEEEDVNPYVRAMKDRAGELKLVTKRLLVEESQQRSPPPAPSASYGEGWR